MLQGRSLRVCIVMSLFISFLCFATTDKPNIILFLVDDLGWADLGCYGSAYHETPNIDQLCREGMKFTNAYSAGPMCAPTRASILSGKTPAQLHMTSHDVFNGIQPNLTGINLDHNKMSWGQKVVNAYTTETYSVNEVTIADILKGNVLDEAGLSVYTSALYGKWHSSARGDGTPTYCGFDKYKARKDNPEDVCNVTQAAKNFISTTTKPFFLHLSYFAMHTDYDKTLSYSSLDNYWQKYYVDGGIEGYQLYEDEYKGWETYFGLTDQADPKKLQGNAKYAALLRILDGALKELRDSLKSTGMDQNTIIIFASDNGAILRDKTDSFKPVTSNWPLRSGKLELEEGGIRIPLIVYWPGRVKAGSVCDVPVSTIDFFPTILDMAGIDDLDFVKTSYEYTYNNNNYIVNFDPKKVEGVSLVPLLTGEGKFERENNALFWHFPHYAWSSSVPCSAVRQGDYKLIKFYEYEGPFQSYSGPMDYDFEGRCELYNLAKDIGEKHDLAKEMPEKVKQLKFLLEDWLEKVDAKMPYYNEGCACSDSNCPKYHPKGHYPAVIVR